MTLRYGKIWVSSVELLKLAGDCPALQTLLQQQQGLVQGGGLAAHHGDTRRQSLLWHILEHWLLHLLTKVHILKEYSV